MNSFEPTQEQIASVKRKLDIVMNMAGEGHEQINVLVYALANSVLDNRVDMTAAINALTAVYLAGIDERYPQKDDDYDY